MNRRNLLIASTAAAMSSAANASPSGLVLVELFTSQGCNSCPAADRALQRLAVHPFVVPLAFHVTYWDRLGWKDSLGDERYTARQRAYAARLPRRQLYTPQMVVAGEIDIVGSDPRLERLVVAVRERVTAAEIMIDPRGTYQLPQREVDGRVDLWWATYDPPQRIAITRGELAGETLEYSHAVRELGDLGTWSGASQTGSLPIERLRRAGRAGLVLVAQRTVDGHVEAIGRHMLS